MQQEKSLIETLRAKGFDIRLEDGKLNITPPETAHSFTPEQIRFLKRRRHQMIAEAVDQLDPRSADSIQSVLAVIRRGYMVQFHSRKTGQYFWLVPDRKTKKQVLAEKRIPEGQPVYGLDELQTMARLSLDANDLKVIGNLIATFDATLVEDVSKDVSENKPQTAEPISVVTAWLDRIGETDPEIRRETLEKARHNSEALQCYLRCAAEHGLVCGLPKNEKPSSKKQAARFRLMRPS